MREIEEFLSRLSTDHRRILRTYLKEGLGHWSPGLTRTELLELLPDRFEQAIDSLLRYLRDEGAVVSGDEHWKLSPFGYQAAVLLSEESASETIALDGRPVETVSDAVYQAQQLYKDVLEFLPNALGSGGGAPEKAGQVQLALRELAAIAKEYFLCNPPGAGMGPWEERFARHGVKYAMKDSKSTMGKFGNERTFIWKGSKRPFVRHLTMTGKYGGVQIYFGIDIESRTFVVAYCGRHLSNTRMNT